VAAGEELDLPNDALETRENDAAYKADSAHLFGDLRISARRDIQGEEAKKWSYNTSKELAASGVPPDIQFICDGGVKI
jgi:hypothetical protein